MAATRRLHGGCYRVEGFAVKREAHRATGEGVGWVEGCKLRAASQGHNHAMVGGKPMPQAVGGKTLPQTTRHTRDVLR